MFTCTYSHTQGGKNVEYSLAQLADSQSTYLMKVLGEMLNKKYPHFTSKSFSIDDLLAWELWPCFIKIYGKRNCCKQNSLDLHVSLIILSNKIIKTTVIVFLSVLAGYTHICYPQHIYARNLE